MYILTVILVFLVILVAGCVMENWLLRRNARKILGQMESVYSGVHEYAAADCRRFSGLDLRFYDDNAAFLQGERFVLLGDVENVTVSLAFPSSRTFIRNLVSEDGFISAGMYYVNPRGLNGLIMKLLLRMGAMGYIDLETEVRSEWTMKDADGREQRMERSYFIVTSNAELSGRMQHPPQFFNEFFPDSTPVQTLLARHRERVEKVRCLLEPGQMDRLVEMRTLADTRAMQNRMELLKADFRRRAGMITSQELSRIGGGELSEEADRLYEAIQAEKIERFGSGKRISPDR